MHACDVVGREARCRERPLALLVRAHAAERADVARLRAERRDERRKVELRIVRERDDRRVTAEVDVRERFVRPALDELDHLAKALGDRVGAARIDDRHVEAHHARQLRRAPRRSRWHRRCRGAARARSSRGTRARRRLRAAGRTVVVAPCPASSGRASFAIASTSAGGSGIDVTTSPSPLTTIRTLRSATGSTISARTLGRSLASAASNARDAASSRGHASISTSIAPPQERPTSSSGASLTENRTTSGTPRSSTSSARRCTSLSTQPALTAPVMRPLRVTRAARPRTAGSSRSRRRRWQERSPRPRPASVRSLEAARASAHAAFPSSVAAATSSSK